MTKKIQIALTSLSFMLLIAGFSATAQTNMTQLAFYENPEAAVAITSPSADMGTVQQGIPVTHAFELENTGTEPLIITKVSKPCGCQQAKWTQEPIMPGEKGTVEATYNAAKEGKFTKSFTVHHNGAGQTLNLVLTGEVKKDFIKETTKKLGVAEGTL